MTVDDCRPLRESWRDRVTMTRQFNIRLAPTLIERVRAVVGPEREWRTVSAFVVAAIVRMLRDVETKP